ncbi:MAG: hypothetical protein QOI25_401 [Mycobacterium sp.]|jgi:acyl dehydratase|nr:hypothetical protein [Mycobacterium sp.]MDT5324522.1 hypothetical protein [Mycobacterium sp.]
MPPRRNPSIITPAEVAQVWPGNRLTATATVQEMVVDKQVVSLAVVVHNQDGREVFTGYATARVDA